MYYTHMRTHTHILLVLYFWKTLTVTAMAFIAICHSSDRKLIHGIKTKRYLALLVSDSDVLQPASSSARSYIFTSVVSKHLGGDLLLFFGIERAGIGVS